LRAFINKTKDALGIDKAISYLLAGKAIALASQPLTIFFIGKFLTSTEQGFYYTFSNIISLSIFLELGLGTILTQFASHEFAHLSWDKKKLIGDEIALSRLLSLCKKTLKWYIIMSAIFSLLIIPFGILFFKSQASNISYIGAWSCLVIFSAGNLIIYSFTAILEGCDCVSDMQLMKMLQSIVGSISVWVVLSLKWGLYAAAGLAFSQFLISVIWLRRKYWPIIKDIYIFNVNTPHQISWKKEILPLQWKIGLSWISGYIIFQSMVPVLFRYRGAVEAGQMGMSLSISNLALVVGLAWLSTKAPSYGALIKLNKIKELQAIVKKNSILSVGVTAFVSFFVVIGAFVIKVYFPAFGGRFLPVYTLAILLIYNVVNALITSIALYLRAFKAEPFLINSMVGALLMGIAIFLCAKYSNADVLCITLLCINLLFSLPSSVFILKRENSKIKILYQ